MTDASASRAWHNVPRWGVWLMLCSVFVHVTGMAFEKMLLGVYHVPQLLFIRSFLRLIPLSITLIRHCDFKTVFSVRQPYSHIFRLIAYVSYNYCILCALSKASLSTVGSLQYITPVFTIVLSVWFLKEKMSAQKWIATGLTALGVLIAIRPSGNLNSIAFLILFASILGSINRIFIRKLTATEHSLAITFFGNLGAVLAFSPALFLDWRPLSLRDLCCFAAAGLLTATAQFLAVQALRFAQASTIASIDCTSIVWGAIFDICIWHVIPNHYFVLGVMLIIVSNLYLLRSLKNIKAKT